MGGSLVFFPVVGLLMGLVLWGLDAVLSAALPPLVVDVLLIGALVIFSGAIHIDGFIDTCDGAVSRRTVAERLAIMSDSRVGAFGVVGGCLLLLLKLGALYSLAPEVRTAALISMPVLGRWSMTYAVFAYPYARGKEGSGYAFKQGAAWWSFALASVTTAAILLAISRGWHGVALVVAAWLFTTALAAYIGSRLRGLTGDSYGALNEANEVLALVLVPILWRFG